MNLQLRQIASAAETKLVLVATVLRFASEPTADLSFVVLALIALRGRLGAIHAIAMSWLFLMLNPAILPGAAYGSIGRYLVLLAATLMLFLRGRCRSGAPRSAAVDAATLALAIFIFYHTLLFSQMVDVSLLKAVSWFLAVVVLIQCWRGLTPQDRDHAERFVYLLLGAVLVLSMPLLAVSEGRAVNGTGFQGILVNPQTFGVTAAMFGAWTALNILAQPRAPFILMATVPLCCVLIVLSEARTALIALVGGVLASVLSASFLSGQRLLTAMPGLRNPRLITGMILGLMAVPIVAVTVESIFATFFAKRTEAGSLLEAYLASRGFLFEMMLRNIEDNFYTGIGFGIGSVPEDMEIVRDPIFGLPVSALVEKGAMLFAVFEELGVFGFFLVLVWVAAVLMQCARNGVVPLGLTLVFLFVNMGEATLFSPGGFGLIGLVVMSWGLTAQHARPQHAHGPSPDWEHGAVARSARDAAG